MPVVSAWRSRLAALAEGREPPVDDALAAIRDVVLVASSSRGGSTVFMEMLRHSTSLLHFQAEINPFLALVGLTWPASGTDSDQLTAAHARGPALDQLRRELASDLGVGGAAGPLDTLARARFARDLCWRLTVQWPEQRFEPEAIERILASVLAELREQEGWPDGVIVDRERFHLRLLGHLRQTCDRIDPYFYDLLPTWIQAAFPTLRPRAGPPSATVVEEPPFVLLAPWRRPSADQLSTLPLVIKTPSNAYRLPFLRALFPQARLRIIHLTRNPAASINGLVDGWRHRGFHAHRLEEPLQIAGYSDLRPADAHWWKYDLPPGWRAWTHRRLEQVCAFQWRSAHTATLRFLDAERVPAHRIRFEDVIASPARRQGVFEALFRWLGMPLDEEILKVVRAGLPPVMATARPRHRRWFEKADQIEPLLDSPELRSVAHQLGYTRPEEWL